MVGLTSMIRKLIFRLRGGAVRRGHSDSVVDTALSRPRDLDDPFSDPKAQTRMAAVIAQQASKGGAAKE